MARPPRQRARNELLTGYDVISLTNFRHRFDAAECTGILRKCRAALSPGGPLATLEFVLNPDRVTPAVSAGFSMTMLLNTPAGDAHTFAELESILHDADFTTNEIHQVPPSPQQLNVSR